MSYHIEVPRSGFKELPDRILVREDGYLGAYKFYGEPIVDYWYVPEQDAPQDALEKRIDELCQEVERLKGENGKLGEQLKLMWLEVWASYYKGVIPYEVYKSTFDRLRELGIEVTP